VYKKTVAYIGDIELKFFPNKFKSKVDYEHANIEEYSLLERVIRIPFIGEWWYVSIDDFLFDKKRSKAKNLHNIINKNFVKMVYDNKLLLNVKIIDVMKKTVVADRTIPDVKFFNEMVYQEIPGHFMFFSIVNSEGTLVSKSLHLISKILNDGWKYDITENNLEHFFINNNKRLYLKDDLAIKITKKDWNEYARNSRT